MIRNISRIIISRSALRTGTAAGELTTRPLYTRPASARSALSFLMCICYRCYRALSLVVNLLLPPYPTLVIPLLASYSLLTRLLTRLLTLVRI